jgi:peptidoglycan/xylan/chitin deacetylase (PgdA/CDA1 family)
LLGSFAILVCDDAGPTRRPRKHHAPVSKVYTTDHWDGTPEGADVPAVGSSAGLPAASLASGSETQPTLPSALPVRSVGLPWNPTPSDAPGGWAEVQSWARCDTDGKAVLSVDGHANRVYQTKSGASQLLHPQVKGMLNSQAAAHPLNHGSSRECSHHVGRLECR